MDWRSVSSVSSIKKRGADAPAHRKSASGQRPPYNAAASSRACSDSLAEVRECESQWIFCSGRCFDFWRLRDGQHSCEQGKSIAYLQLSSGLLEVVNTASDDSHVGALLYKNSGRLKSQALRAAGHVAVLQAHWQICIAGERSRTKPLGSHFFLKNMLIVAYAPKAAMRV
ncbi:uncharacterized protein SCHCODRAFT_02255003 [Schizophyllum commune H4-8]|uniref:uncharacterized protein n=1 Tax=Schizophyllum commune (strain H4-8 / FGSC 9210) TaxID=578458 RepID=UPI00215E1D11|nr:uncharacterized protein SCHCODRAFT_02255003 [Schizophyllum commune H4-8]KAI5893512.1 hypothetical protein SCHCODRAFT_02255003 [Schizophyllum commune H4-8]